MQQVARNCAGLVWLIAFCLPARCQTSVSALGSLKGVSIPAPPDLDHYVRDPKTLLVLGKALFWDMQVGSDGRTACATCHFHAGSDHRSRNVLSNPGAAFTPNRQLAADDFPFRQFADLADNRSAVLRDSSQRTGSAGMFRRIFSALTGTASEQATDTQDSPAFQIGGLNVRQVTTRNAPSVINAVLNARNFRDGRASDVFNGRTPFGDSDPRPNALAVVGGRVVPEKVRILNSSLASQAIEPPLNPVEMSYEGRTWPELGRKLLAARPLALQHVAPDDSVLADYANPDGPGLAPSYTYLSLVQAAFQPAYWDTPVMADESGNPSESGGPGKFTVAEYNFPLFFGLAIQAYESTLVSDDSPFDRFTAGEADSMTPQEHSGFLDFQTDAFCQFCHSGPEMTRASFNSVAAQGAIDSVLTGSPGSLLFLAADTGFFKTGVRPDSEDPGLDGTDDFGVPFSLAARASLQPLGILGAFKVPGLRNVEFTGPYFHNGGQATLEQVLRFYARGGDFPDSPNLPVEIIPVPLSAAEQGEIVAFLKSLSDDRVRYERAPFDHPELCVPVGYPDTPRADPAFPSSAVDLRAGVPAVGQNGNAVPLQTFEELLEGVGTDGSRAHTLTDPCAIR